MSIFKNVLFPFLLATFTLTAEANLTKLAPIDMDKDPVYRGCHTIDTVLTKFNNDVACRTDLAPKDKTQHTWTAIRLLADMTGLDVLEDTSNPDQPAYAFALNDTWMQEKVRVFSNPPRTTDDFLAIHPDPLLQTYKLRLLDTMLTNFAPSKTLPNLEKRSEQDQKKIKKNQEKLWLEMLSLQVGVTPSKPAATALNELLKMAADVSLTQAQDIQRDWPKIETESLDVNGVTYKLPRMDAQALVPFGYLFQPNNTAGMRAQLSALQDYATHLFSGAFRLLNPTL